MKKFISLACLSAAFVAAPAAATTVTSIRITNANPTWLQVAELQAYQGGVNVALATAGATATGSGNYVTQTTPDQAIDGNISGAYPDLYHSDSPDGSEFLLVTLAQAYDISRLTIFGRADGSGTQRDLYDYTLFNGQSVVGTGTLDARGATHSATTTFAVSGGVPEPTTWAMAIIGFGMIGGAARRSTASGRRFRLAYS